MNRFPASTASGFFRMEASAWESLLELLPRPLSREHAAMDLRHLADQVRLYDGGRLPDHDELAVRWGWTSATGRPATKRVRLLKADEEAWIDPYRALGRRRGQAKGRRRAAEGQAKGRQPTSEPDESSDEGQAKGSGGAGEGQQEGHTRGGSPAPDTFTGTLPSHSSEGAGVREGENWEARPWAEVWDRAWKADGRGSYPWDRDPDRARLRRIADAAGSLERAGHAFAVFLAAHRSSSPPWPPEESPTLLKFCKKLADRFVSARPPEREREPGEEDAEGLGTLGEIRVEPTPGGRWRMWEGSFELTQTGDVSEDLAIELLDMLVASSGLDPPTRDRLVETILAHTHPEAAK